MNDRPTLDRKTAYRAAYHDRLAAQFDQWCIRIDALTLRAAQARTDGRLQLLDLVHELNLKRRELGGKILELRDAQEDRWDRLKHKIEDAAEELKKGMDQAVHALRN